MKRVRTTLPAAAIRQGRKRNLGGDPNFSSSKATFLDNIIDISWVSDNVAIPTSWVDELTSADLLNPATQLATACADAAGTPFIISSGAYDLEGRRRDDSPSHLSHVAVDIAPMFSRDIILPPDPPLSGLSLNIAFLSILARALTASPYVCVVEADHIHMLMLEKSSLAAAARQSNRADSSAALSSMILSVPNVSSAYALCSHMPTSAPVLLYSPSAWTLAPCIGAVNGLSLLTQICEAQEALMSSAHDTQVR